MSSINRKILRTFNSCDRKEFYGLLDEITKTSSITKIFTSKWYLWNWFRPRDFYKTIADYVVDKLKSGTPENNQLAEDLIRVILATTKTEKIKQSFVWNITKRCPILMIEMMPYISAERIHSILYSDKLIYADNYLSPIIREVIALRNKLSDRCQ